jgi:predicted metalloprotease with PDZ domain
MPNVERQHHWLEEGLATYVEPIVRARAGLVSLEEVWHDWITDMPKGLPEEGDLGLDRTHTWGRTYWGGAVFCLVADVAIRKRTGNRRSLGDALRAIVAQGGNVGVRWPLQRVLAVGDAATGVKVLRETYDRMATHAEGVDLATLWAELGVRIDRGTVRFDDTAPLAGIRRAMVTAGP